MIPKMEAEFSTALSKYCSTAISSDKALPREGSHLKSKRDRKEWHEDPVNLPDQCALSLLAILVACVDDGRGVLFEQVAEG